MPIVHYAGPNRESANLSTNPLRYERIRMVVSYPEPKPCLAGDLSGFAI